MIGNQVVRAGRTSLRIAEAAEVLRISPRRVRRLVAHGHLTDVSTSRGIRLDPAEVAALIADRPVALALLGAIVSQDRWAGRTYRSLSDRSSCVER